MTHQTTVAGEYYTQLCKFDLQSALYQTSEVDRQMLTQSNEEGTCVNYALEPVACEYWCFDVYLRW
jgi:hypothetical protein